MKKKKISPANIIIEVVLLALGFIVLIPFFLMILGSLKDSVETTTVSLALPTQWRFDNFSFVIHEGGMIRAFLNSLLISCTSVLLVILLSSICGFVISRKKATSRAIQHLYNYIILGIIAPMQIVTTFVLFRALNISGYMSVILVYVAINLSFSTVLYESFTGTVPRELDEAAVIDGCGPLRLFYGVVFPVLMPVTLTVVVTIAISVWNDFMVPLYLLSSSRYWTLPLTVYNFFGQYRSNWNYVYANLTITALPMIIIYFVFQKYIVDGMTAGAVKG